MIQIRVPAAIPTDQATDAYREALLEMLADMARAEWVRLAQLGLKSTQRAYINGIQAPFFTDEAVSIDLVGAIPNMVEHGWAAKDLHETLLMMNAKKRQSKDGHWYAYIPFRHGTPKSSGKNVGAPMPSDIANMAKKLTPTLTAPGGGGTNWGGSLPAGLAPKAKPTHVTDLFAGMYRFQKTYEKATQNSYGTFRTISSNPASKSFPYWRHPGIEARDLMPQVQRFLEGHSDEVSIGVSQIFEAAVGTETV